MIGVTQSWPTAFVAFVLVEDLMLSTKTNRTLFYSDAEKEVNGNGEAVFSRLSVDTPLLTIALSFFK